jgi:diguanylate cyclase (GGDEF)-like protein
MAVISKIETGGDVCDAQLRQFRIFDEVDLERIRPLLRQCHKQNLAAGDVLLRPEFRNDSLFMLLSGKVVVTLESLDAAPLLELTSGECIGEMSVLDGRNPSAYVKAVEPCEVLVIERSTLWQLIDSSHSLCRNLLHFLSDRLRSGNHFVAISQSREKEQERAANMDALTGVHNRRWLQEALATLKAEEDRDKLPLAVLMLDVDHFKTFNDTYGHKAGDLVLQMVARTIRRSLRPSDMLARYGGEEFVVILPTTPVKQAMAVAERLRCAVASSETSVEQGQALPPVTISIGVAALADMAKLEQAFETADKALYEAKRLGRDRVELRG